MKYGYFATLCAGLSACTTVSAALPAPTNALSDVLMAQTEGCLTGKMEQFGRYLGDWDIQDWQLEPDGASWTEQQGARWNFTCVGNGVAMQDFWMPNAGGYGTNLRMHNSDTDSWDITWAASSLTGMAHISAVEDEAGNIVMHYVSPPQTPERQITFFPPDATGWDWSLEISPDAGETWRTVYKIRATARPNP